MGGKTSQRACRVNRAPALRGREAEEGRWAGNIGGNMNFDFDFCYTMENGISVRFVVTAPPSAFAGGDEADLSSAEIRDLISEAFGQSIPALAAMLHPTIRQVEQALLHSYTNSLKKYIKENAPPLDSPLATAFAGEQRRQ